MLYLQSFSSNMGCKNNDVVCTCRHEEDELETSTCSIMCLILICSSDSEYGQSLSDILLLLLLY